jgi:hypothetical protein
MDIPPIASVAPEEMLMSASLEPTYIASVCAESTSSFESIKPKLNALQSAEIFEKLYELYTPRTDPLAWVALQTIRYENGKSYRLEAAPVLMFVNLFVEVLRQCVELGSKDEIIRIFVNNFSQSHFTDRLKKLGLRTKEYSEWSSFIMRELNYYLECMASFKAFHPVRADTNKQRNNASFSTSNLVAATAQNSRSTSKPQRRPADMCLGCGHVTNPPHKRNNCPHKGKIGWCADGFPSNPMVVTVFSPKIILPILFR